MQASKRDDRLVAGDQLLEVDELPSAIREVVAGLVAYADERLRVNVGKDMENNELRRRVRELEEGPSDVQVAGTPTDGG